MHTKKLKVNNPIQIRPHWRDVVDVMTEEELLARAVEERKTIVEKYKHGRQEGADLYSKSLDHPASYIIINIDLN